MVNYNLSEVATTAVGEDRIRSPAIVLHIHRRDEHFVRAVQRIIWISQDSAESKILAKKHISIDYQGS